MFQCSNISVVDESPNSINGTEMLGIPQAFSWFFTSSNNTTPENATNMAQVSCERVNIMGTIVQDSAPYLYPFIIEYSLIGAAVIYVMWKHIGRYPR